LDVCIGIDVERRSPVGGLSIEVRFSKQVVIFDCLSIKGKGKGLWINLLRSNLLTCAFVVEPVSWTLVEMVGSYILFHFQICFRMMIWLISWYIHVHPYSYITIGALKFNLFKLVQYILWLCWLSGRRPSIHMYVRKM